MKIKQIELNGFKSFADKTLFPLHSGITCIVGPNGCGKSNVVDAFRWVLGEQSAKSLRGERMEEVIFQGSATKKQKGMSEVSLIISQSGQTSGKNKAEGGNGSSDSDSPDEVSVARRLYRSGESEYILNNKQCRLKDIKDIFLDTGLDVKSYSILDQGRIGEIINTKPHDRRFLIEEVAGVMKYKVRKAEALSKLESSKQNLQRISDIVYEVKRQINSLDRQVKKAERYKRLIEELKELDLRIAKREHLRMTGTLNSLLSEIERLKEEDSSKRAELSTLENFIESKRIELVEREKALSVIENSLLEKEKAIADSEKNIAVLKTNIENKKMDIARLAGQQEETDAKKSELSGKIIELDENENSLISKIEEVSSELGEKREWAENIETAIKDKETGIEDKRKDLFKVSEHLGNKKNDYHKFQSSLETLRYRESSALKDMDTIRDGIGEMEQATRETEEAIRVKTEEQQKLREKRETLTAGIARIEAGIEEKKAALSQERESLASNASRLNSLKEMIIDKSLMDFFSGEGSAELKAPGHKVLSDIISADKNYEAAIESVLAEKVNSLIISELGDLMSVISLIKEKNLGRTAMLYTGLFKGGSQSASPFEHPSLIGRASDFISVESGSAQNIAHHLLENTYIVKDMQSALEILNSSLITHYSSLNFVTLDGEVISRDGWIFAGHGKDILKRKREIKELQKLTDEQQITITDLESGLNAISSSLSGEKESLKAVENSIIDVEKDASLLNQSLENQKEELERKTRRIEFLDTEIKTISGEKESLENLLESKANEIQTIEEDKSAVDKEIALMQQTLINMRAEYEEARSHLTEIKLALTSHREKLDALKKERANITSAIAELENRKEQAIREIRESETKIAESLSELQMLEESIKALIGDADRTRQEREALREAISSENQDLILKENDLKKIRLEIDALSQQLSDLNSKAVENRLRIENIESSIHQKYGLDIETETLELEPFDPVEDENRASEVNNKIRDLGPVNLGTIEEYEELKTRYDFLTKQQEDLNMSIAELEEAISRINSTTRKKLREAYDALREKFTEVFTTLFGGGRADLVLTDEENILESGLDIIAQPPGKKLQNLNLLSGGEKALTSLALLFGGFLIKPSPLCVLDEADAPLDESNTVRFAQMLKDLSNETQFIVITHNRRTMEVADYIYGITMEEPGASKAISLQFADIEISQS
jgi:chromosome segregation protein